MGDSGLTDFGKQVADMVQGAIDSREFAELRQTVERTVSAAGEGMRKAQTDFVANMAAARRAEQERAARERVAARYGSATGLRVSGAAMAANGGFFAFSFILSAVAVFAFPFPGSLLTGLFLLATGLLFVWMCASGCGRVALAGRFDAYRRAIGSREVCTVAELSNQVGTDASAVRRDLRRLLSAGLFREGHLDGAARRLYVTHEAYAGDLEAGAADGSPEPPVAVEAVVEDVADEPAPGPVAPEVAALVERGEDYLAQIRAANAAIDDDGVSAKVDRIECVVANIFAYASEHPEVADDLERLMNYYLPTTVKLLRAYDDLEEQPVQGVNIATSRREIEETLDTLTGAYERLLDSIFRDMAWDVSADISVLNDVLAQEGLIDDRGGRGAAAK